ncbi:transposon Tf2-9 polyprotein [Trichonephila clavipes]|nr:transposon Tf2-9 polyprotein [Trichonephila clavipes]
MLATWRLIEWGKGPWQNCGGGDRWCRHLSSLREFRRANSYCHLNHGTANCRLTPAESRFDSSAKLEKILIVIKVTVQFDKFDEENENFDSFIERFETYLDVQNVPIANRAKVFVSSLSAKLYQLLKNLLAPDIPSDQTLDKLKDALKKHLTPKPLIIPSRHKFLNRKQTEGEGISTYIAELRALAMNCDYDKDMLNIMLRDVFKKVDSSEWATPVVPVVKSDGSIRLCADYSVTLNPNLIVPQHPLPRLDEIFGSLNGGNNLQN